MVLWRLHTRRFPAAFNFVELKSNILITGQSVLETLLNRYPPIKLTNLEEFVDCLFVLYLSLSFRVSGNSVSR